VVSGATTACRIGQLGFPAGDVGWAEDLGPAGAYGRFPVLGRGTGVGGLAGPLPPEQPLAVGDGQRGGAEQCAQVLGGLLYAVLGEAGAQRGRGKRRGVQGRERRPVGRRAEVTVAAYGTGEDERGRAEDERGDQRRDDRLHAADASWLGSAPMPEDPFAAVAKLPGVADAVASARAAVDALYGHRVLRRRRTEVTAESALRGARASAALDGADVPLPALRSGTAFDRSAHGAVVRAAVRVSAEVAGLLGVWEKAPTQALARLHVVAAADVVGNPDELGRPVSAEAAARLEQLSDLLVARSAAPAPVVAAIVHGELLAVRPFAWGSGLVARAAARLVLVQRGTDPKALCAPEVGHVEIGREAYEDALAAYTSGSRDGVGRWVRHCALAVELGAREATAICEAMLRG